jgi:hypothetical protein
MIPSSVFPTLNRLYSNHTILAIPEAWKADFGWSVNVHTQLPVLSQIRVLKEEAFTEVSLVLSNNNTKEEIFIEWKIDDFNFCRPAKRKRHFANAFLL